MRRLGLYFPLVLLLLGYWLPLLVWLVKVGGVGTEVFSNIDLVLPLIVNTLYVSLVVTAASFLLAYPLAVLWWLSNDRLAIALALVVFLPVTVGFLARNYSWIGMLSGRDVLSSMALSVVGAEKMLYTFASVTVVMTYIFVPISFFVLIHALGSISTDEINVAKTLGATDGEILRKVAIPHTYRQAVFGAVIVFASAMAYFVTPKMLGGGNFDMLGNLIWEYADLGDFESALSVSALYLFVFGIIYALMIVLAVLNRGKVLGR